MSNSVFVPMCRLPKDIAELRKIIIDTFIDLCRPPPEVRLEINGIRREEGLISDGLIVYEGLGDDEMCWSTIGPESVELTEDPAANFLADVTTRGSRIFAGIVAYALCKAYGKVVFNDSGSLGEQERYTAESLREKLMQTVNKMDKPSARGSNF